jgi:hypothetical protein
MQESAGVDAPAHRERRAERLAFFIACRARPYDLLGLGNRMGATPPTVVADEAGPMADSRSPYRQEVEPHGDRAL